MVTSGSAIKVADECWVALALLTLEHPDREGFAAREIVNRLRSEGAYPTVRAGVSAHISQHNVANVEPSTARYRMFLRLPGGGYRLWRPGDACSPDRKGKMCPVRDELPPCYHHLLDGYQTLVTNAGDRVQTVDPVLGIRGVGKEIWRQVNSDLWLEKLRDWSQPDAAGKAPIVEKQDYWHRVLQHQGEEFHTIQGHPYTYRVEGNSGMWFYRDGQLVNRRLPRSEFEAALAIPAVSGPAQLGQYQCPSYLYGLLADDRITGAGRRRR